MHDPVVLQEDNTHKLEAWEKEWEMLFQPDKSSQLQNQELEKHYQPLRRLHPPWPGPGHSDLGKVSWGDTAEQPLVGKAHWQHMCQGKQDAWLLEKEPESCLNQNKALLQGHGTPPHQICAPTRPWYTPLSNMLSYKAMVHPLIKYALLQGHGTPPHQICSPARPWCTPSSNIQLQYGNPTAASISPALKMFREGQPVLTRMMMWGFMSGWHIRDKL